MFSRTLLKERLYIDFMQRVVYFDLVEKNNIHQIYDGYHTIREFIGILSKYSNIIFDYEDEHFYLSLNNGLIKYRLYNIDIYTFELLKEIVYGFKSTNKNEL